MTIWIRYVRAKHQRLYFQTRPLQKGCGGGRKREGLFHWGERRLREHFLMPFKNIKDITEKIMTCHSIATKDKRNGTEPRQGNPGLNMRKNFLTAKVIQHR